MRRNLAILLMSLLTCLAVTAAFAREIKVVMLGDSMTAGYGLTTHEALPHQLEKWLKNQGLDVEIIARGISGDTTYGGRIRAHFLPKDADAVIVELGANDILLHLSPTRAARNLRAIVARAGAGGRPVMVLGMDPFWAPPPVRHSWREIWGPLAAMPHIDFIADILAPIAARRGASRSDWLQSDGLHLNRDGIAAMVDHIGPPIAVWLQQETPR